MDFDDAISTHTSWKMKLRNYIEGNGEDHDASKVEKDNLCVLGKWIYSQERGMRDDADYIKLKKDHATFHQHAAEVIRLSDAGKKAQADDLLNGDYRKNSTQVIGSIMNLQQKAKG